MKKTLFLLFLLANISVSHACLNYFYSIDKDGHFHDAEDLQRGFNTNFNRKLIQQRLEKLQKKLQTENDYKLLSDYAVLLLKAGKTEIALDILEQLSIQHPNDYHIAANLGTAYELSGDNEKALHYIKRGLELNPNSHGGSEWVHVALLEVKLKLASDSTYLNNRTVLDLTEAQENDTRVRDQLMIQIRERFPFCKGPNDPIMASLLIDLGDCYKNTASLEFAKACYEIAHHYYGAPFTAVEGKINDVKRLIRQYINLPINHTLRSEYREGEHNRMSPIRYQRLLDDNNPDNYQINWALVQSNADTLLSWANIERFVPETPAKNDSIGFIGIERDTPNKNPASQSGSWLYFLIAGLAIAIGAIVFFLRKKK